MDTKQKMHNQNEAVSALQRKRLDAGVKKSFLQEKNFSLLLVLCITLSAMDSTDIVSSIKHPRSLTLECYLICISPCFMLLFLMFFFLDLEARSIDFVLSSPMWILRLFSAN